MKYNYFIEMMKISSPFKSYHNSKKVLTIDTKDTSTTIGIGFKSYTLQTIDVNTKVLIRMLKRLPTDKYVCYCTCSKTLILEIVGDDIILTIQYKYY